MTVVTLQTHKAATGPHLKDAAGFWGSIFSFIFLALQEKGSCPSSCCLQEGIWGGGRGGASPLLGDDPPPAALFSTKLGSGLQEEEAKGKQILQNNFGGSSGIWPRLKRDRRRDGRSLFGPPGQLAKREQPGTGNEEERRRVSIPAVGKGDVRMGV
ncbi:hypothetical protein DUI87_24274 [Hirundo rustica rustica]|uniref:Uncharacterized protein n=1 Tax=Hirundo rustica rustica TaxID=333673 RepID=A0A3M0JEC6_HIRRU|nr:hypothetical protein DUI87_24274 [Hirundo rustica rustica]